MSLTPSKTDREYTKFRDAGQGLTKIATVIEGDTGLIEGVQYDDIQASYPTASTENYSYYLDTILQATIEVSYTDSTKIVFLRARRI